MASAQCVTALDAAGSIREAVGESPPSRQANPHQARSGAGGLTHSTAQQQTASQQQHATNQGPQQPQQQAEQAQQQRQRPQEQFLLHRVLGPLGMLPSLAGGADKTPPQLALLPVRVALRLLGGMPRHFLLLTDVNEVGWGRPFKT